MEKIKDLISANKCTGCFSCFNACKHNAISMSLDADGFYLPEINISLCNNCQYCESVCPVLNIRNDTALKENTKYPKAYAAWSKDDSIIKRSSSGGLFSEIAKTYLENNYYVCGAAFNKNFELCHVIINTEIELPPLCGSKYIQSNIHLTYQEIQKLLTRSKKVLFVGTPCQVAGLKKFLGQEFKSLVTVDLICHGVGSTIVFMEYLKSITKHSPIKDIKFRDKFYGWKCYNISITFTNKFMFKEIFKNNAYMISFLKNLNLRESCYDCHFTETPRSGDITLGDFWGYPQRGKKGVSALLINTKNGEELLNELLVTNRIKNRPCSTDLIFKTNNRLYKSKIKRPDSRNAFFYTLKNKGYSACEEKFLKKTFIKRKINILRSLFLRFTGL